ncbi:MAG TPA: serine hydrolase [Vicinamibacterales bacterium]|nr:serine hydrolase [Vicinamibacterales bacterium]
MQQKLERAAADFDGVLGVAAKNLLTGEEILWNADMRFPTASTIKTAVMIEAYHQAAEGKLSLDDRVPLRGADKVGGSGVLNGLADGLELKVRDLVSLMIVLSDNTATNMLVTRLGSRHIDDRLAAYGLAHTKIFRPTFRDGRADVFPELEREFGLGMTTPREMARMMALIADGKAVSPLASAEMLATLRRQQDRSMIPRLLPSDGSIDVGNKTGTDSEKLADAGGRRGAIRADAAIVTGTGVKYVVAIYTRRGADGRSGVDNAALMAGARISRMVFDYFTGGGRQEPGLGDIR